MFDDVKHSNCGGMQVKSSYTVLKVENKCKTFKTQYDNVNYLFINYLQVIVFIYTNSNNRNKAWFVFIIHNSNDINFSTVAIDDSDGIKVFGQTKSNVR